MNASKNYHFHSRVLKSGIKAAAMAVPVVIDLGGAKMLSQELDFGSSYGTQGRLNWIEPALLKRMPTAVAPPQRIND